jgi:Predicted transcriptional regulators
VVNLRGTLSTLILEALAQHPDHGYSIAQRIKERSRGVLDFKEGTLYPALQARKHPPQAAGGAVAQAAVGLTSDA